MPVRHGIGDLIADAYRITRAARRPLKWVQHRPYLVDGYLGRDRSDYERLPGITRSSAAVAYTLRQQDERRRG
ncbi:hypothetical protein [Streptomyces hygroscopicus]|uniref:hypothetical protein n=1 Tax=Streptomyces hygroscopicus TaxID=1912 RepID=UPI002240AEE5|nr:hypothetical protein [Streptomyces hygroscopicus]